jgi:high-affinity iron transporter
LYAALLLSFREGLEAALILGIIWGVLNRLGQTGRARIVWWGAGVAGLLSVVIGVGLYTLGIAFEGRSEEIFEGVAMLLAAGVLTWMIFWMSRQSRALRAELERDVRRAAMDGKSWALFSLAFVAVLREGVELALFLTAAAFSASASATLVGGLLGLILAAIAGWLLFATTVRLDVRMFFRVTGALLIFFAAGLVAHGVHELNEAGWIPALIEHVWDVNPALNEESSVGLFFKALLGYNGNPSLTELLAYVGYWSVILWGLWRFRVRAEQVRAIA